jgi:beta-1,2-mannosyltransferase
VEDGVKDAEPVVVFNTISSRSDWSRAMWILRPFSGFSTILTVREHQRRTTEKNWAPFFLDTLPSTHPDQHNDLHFVYEFHPLRILRCNLFSGDCEFAFEQSLPEDLVTKHDDSFGSLRGGTNFVPLPMQSRPGMHPQVRTWVGFPRTHIDAGCAKSVYRPVLAVLVKTGPRFHLTYASNSLELGSAALSAEAKADPCENGRILIPNSVALWDTSSGRDIMTITLSVQDSTVQVARVQGLLSLTRNLPRLQELLTYDSAPVGQQERLGMHYSLIGEDVRACSVEAAIQHAIMLSKVSAKVHGNFKVSELVQKHPYQLTSNKNIEIPHPTSR